MILFVPHTSIDCIVGLRGSGDRAFHGARSTKKDKLNHSETETQKYIITSYWGIIHFSTITEYTEHKAMIQISS